MTDAEVDIDLKIVDRLFPVTLATEEDVWSYIDYLAAPGDRMAQLLANTKDPHLVAHDLIQLVEFANTCPRQNDEDGGPGKLVDAIVGHALERSTPIATTLINRLYVRGFAKELTKAMLLHFSETVSATAKVGWAKSKGRLTESNATLRLCAHALRAMGSKIDILHKGDHKQFRFPFYRDHNVAVRVAELFLDSAVMNCPNGNNENMLSLFHPKSGANIPPKMQLFVLEVLEQRAAVDVEAASESADHPPLTARDRDMALDVGATLLKRLVMLWSDQSPHGASSVDHVYLAAAIMKCMGFVYKVDDRLLSPEFDVVSTFINQGAIHKLDDIDSHAAASAMGLTAYLSRWTVSREKLMGRTLDHVLKFQQKKADCDESLIYMELAHAPFVVENSASDDTAAPERPARQVSVASNRKVTAQQSTSCESKVTGARAKKASNAKHTKPHPEVHAMAPGGQQVHTVDAAPEMPVKDDTGSDGCGKGQLDRLVDQVFTNVPVLDLFPVPTMTQVSWADPPQHIQQCFERLCGAPVVGDVEPAKLLNSALNKPPNFSNAQMRELFVQTVMYMPAILTVNEPVVERYAVPICQLLLKIDDFQPYEDCLTEILSKFQKGGDLFMDLPPNDPLRAALNGTYDFELVSVQSLTFSIMETLTFYRPRELFKFYCGCLNNTEYTQIQRLNMLECMDTAVQLLSRGYGDNNKAYCQYMLQRTMRRFIKMQNEAQKGTDSRKGARKITNLKSAAPVTPQKEITLEIRNEATVKTADLLKEAAQRAFGELSQFDCRTDASQRDWVVEMEPPSSARSSGRTNPSSAGKTANTYCSKIINETKIGNISLQARRTVSTTSKAQVSLSYRLTAPIESKDDAPPPAKSNAFAPLANDAVSWLMVAAEEAIKTSMADTKSLASKPVVYGIFMLLGVFIRYSGGRVSPGIIDQCKRLASETAKKAARDRHLESALLCLTRNIQAFTEEDSA
ncbi:protocadherin Fat 3-like protein, putative [Babesia caballi]|uniref:Protocadherin Fat 3-like protein, putative n=1 Tax=Babesia caballi TaxID=5871 RepID=A0AAV4LUJ5_BABCB|nr:protocadherin Fat 3-like protein, putative [Babesia caballi]